MYTTHIIKKIEYKKDRLEKINQMIAYYASGVILEFESKLQENNIGKPDWSTHIFKADDPLNIDSDELSALHEKIYKKLILQVHPDRNTTASSNDFIPIHQAYQNKDIWLLIKYANNYLLNDLTDLDINLMILLLERTLYDTKNKISKAKSTLVYQIIVEDKKNLLINHFIEMDKLCKENEKIRKENKELQGRLNNKS